MRAQIEQDKRDRAERAAREKALREGRPLPGASSAPSAATAAGTLPRQTSNASEARLRVRAPSGMWMGTLPAEATLADVESAVNSEHGTAAQLVVRLLLTSLRLHFHAAHSRTKSAVPRCVISALSRMQRSTHQPSSWKQTHSRIGAVPAAIMSRKTSVLPVRIWRALGRVSCVLEGSSGSRCMRQNTTNAIVSKKHGRYT